MLYFFRFYSTYEELKLGLEKKIPKIKNCFYSTYEELKRFPSAVLAVVSACFYSTYEELKLGYSKISNGIFIVFTVPMRN